MFREANKMMLTNIETSDMVDVREDEEQSIKLNQILEMLVNAGYYRARIRGLANFDKIVGGMTWCIESCYFDVDVDLLFQENFIIGQKIALTEKIVVMLPKMKCPYRIEPHQIQGLDYIHIFPVIQWLVEESLKTREEMTDSVRSFAIIQFDKEHTTSIGCYSADASNKIYHSSNIKFVEKAYKARRLFKQNDTVPTDEFCIVSNALLEYGEALQISQNLINKLQEMKTSNLSLENEITKEVVETKIEEKKKVDALMENLLKFDDNEDHVSSNIIGRIVHMQAQELADAVEHYATLSACESQNEVSSATKAISTLEKRKSISEYQIEKISLDNRAFRSTLKEVKKHVDLIQDKHVSINGALERMKYIGSSIDQGLLRLLEDLLTLHERLRDQENEFRDQCRSDLDSLNGIVNDVLIEEPQKNIDCVAEYLEQKAVINKLRLLLAKKNRAIAILARQWDDVPGRSELTQYQRRFMELYNQVSAKHEETKQYYTLYNTLDNTKLYLSKELSLLNSIQENYNEAMSSCSGRDQFIRQFESIVDGVQNNKAKVEKRCMEEKSRKNILSRQLIGLIEQQRKYVSAVRQLTVECRKNEILLAQLRGS